MSKTFEITERSKLVKPVNLVRQRNVSVHEFIQSLRIHNLVVTVQYLSVILLNQV